MPIPSTGQQTLGNVIGTIVLVMVVCVVLPMFWENLWFDADRAPADALRGGILGIWFVTSQYVRLPVEKRLSSLPTIGLAIGYLALVIWGTLTAPRAMDWVMGLLLAAASLPGVYLLLKGTQSLRSAGR